MHNIYECVDSFVSLLDTEYRLILGRKGEAVSLNVTFDKKDCFHLMGLQYLTDRPELNRDRGKIFDDIKARILTKEQIESSDLYRQIAERVDMLPFLEDMFDSNDTIFRYNEKKNSFSMIRADYLMKNRLIDKNVFIFLSKDKNDTYFCRSFFPETKRDYTKNQASWTLLYKEKIKRSTGQSVVLYDRLKRT
jgi:hypothetical protein